MLESSKEVIGNDGHDLPKASKDERAVFGTLFGSDEKVCRRFGRRYSRSHQQTGDQQEPANESCAGTDAVREAKLAIDGIVQQDGVYDRTEIGAGRSKRHDFFTTLGKVLGQDCHRRDVQQPHGTSRRYSLSEEDLDVFVSPYM